MSNSGSKGFGIFPRILLTMLLVALVPLGATWFVNFKTTTNQLREQVNRELGLLTSRLVDFADGWVEMNRRMLIQNADLADMRSMRPDLQTPILRQIAEGYDWTYLVFTTDRSGNNLARSDGKALKYYGDRAYVRQVLEGASLADQVLLGKTSGKPALVLAAPINNDQRDLQGVLALAMTTEKLSEVIVRARIGRSGTAFLLDRSGKVIAHRSNELALQRKDLSNHPAFLAASASGPSHISYSDADGRRLIAHVAVTDQGWVLVTELPYAEAYAAISVATRNAVVLLLGTLVLVVISAYAVASRLSAPIRHLTEVADEISRGKLDAVVPATERRDEIGALARSIERLGSSVKYAMQRLKRKRHHDLAA